MKCCAKCGETKSLKEFYHDLQRKGGKDTYCKLCRNAVNSASVTKEASCRAKAAYKTRQREATKDARAAKKAKRRQRTLANHRRIKKAWKRRHPGIVNADRAERRCAKLQATPVWANAFFIKEIYALAALRTKMTGIKWHVDHEVPLRSKIVCGLHCEANLRVVPAVVNTSKGNRYWQDMP